MRCEILLLQSISALQRKWIVHYDYYKQSFVTKCLCYELQLDTCNVQSHFWHVGTEIWYEKYMNYCN